MCFWEHGRSAFRAWVTTTCGAEKTALEESASPDGASANSALQDE